MPRAAKPPHLVWVKPKYNKETGKLVSNGYWAIKHRSKLVSTGLGFDAREFAEGKRLEYELALRSEKTIREIVGESGKSAREVFIADLVQFYVERRREDIHAKNQDRRRDYLNTIERLLRFWGEKNVADINERTIADYQAKARGGKPLSDNQTRRDLQDLKAIVHFGIRKGLCELKGHIIDWELPPAPEPRMEFYSRSEVARLIWKAYRARNTAIGGPSGHKTSVHLARFILIAVYTGTRAEKIETASYFNVDDRPWIDLENGIFYRSGVSNKSPMNKRADPARIPDRLLAHLRRWAASSRTGNVVEHNGEFGSTRRAFHRLKKAVFDEERARKVNRHTFKHTCASWLMQQRVPVSIIANFLSTTEAVILKHYGHFSPDFHSEVNDAMREGRNRAIEASRRRRNAA